MTSANIFPQANLVRIRRPFLVDTQRSRNALDDGSLSFCLRGGARSKNNTPILPPLATSHDLEGKTERWRARVRTAERDAREVGQWWSKKSDLMCSNRALYVHKVLQASVWLRERPQRWSRRYAGFSASENSQVFATGHFKTLRHLGCGLALASRMYNWCVHIVLFLPKYQFPLAVLFFFSFLTSPSRENARFGCSKWKWRDGNERNKSSAKGRVLHLRPSISHNC